jgi:predicted acetyltransferase
MGLVVPSVRLRPMSPDDEPVLARLWQLYRHDLATFRDSYPDDRGRFTGGRLPDYVHDPDRRAYLFDVHLGEPGSTGSRPAGQPWQLAGFVLVRGVEVGPRLMGEFFVVRSVRRLGVGRAAALSVMAAHPGEWLIPFQEENPGAARFWRLLATELTGETGQTWREQLRPVPEKPWIPPDVWLSLTMR